MDGRDTYFAQRREACVIDDTVARAAVAQGDPNLPAHQRIERWIADSVERGALVAGDKLPAERDFAASFGVSRMTLRQALAALEQRGVIQRTPGRFGGAFIREPRVECDLTGLLGFTEQMRRGGRQVTTEVVSATRITSPRDVAEQLDLAVGDGVYEIVRLRSDGDAPLALERSYLPERSFPGLLEQPLGGSLYDLLRDVYDKEPITAVEFLEPVIADPAAAALLRVANGSPVMLIERLTRSLGGVPVDFARDLFRTDRIRIMVRSGANSDADPAS
jgi:GntR family transcriptional regulator